MKFARIAQVTKESLPRILPLLDDRDNKTFLEIVTTKGKKLFARLASPMLNNGGIFRVTGYHYEFEINLKYNKEVGTFSGYPEKEYDDCTVYLLNQHIYQVFPDDFGGDSPIKLLIDGKPITIISTLGDTLTLECRNYYGYLGHYRESGPIIRVYKDNNRNNEVFVLDCDKRKNDNAWLCSSLTHTTSQLSNVPVEVFIPAF